MKSGLQEKDFLPILDAITDAFEKHDLASIETDLLFKYADKDKNGLISEEEYINWNLNEAELAMRKAEREALMKPVIQTLTANVQRAMLQLLDRVGRKT